MATALALALRASPTTGDEGRATSRTVVRTVDELRRAAATARPGTRILLAPGTYAGGVLLADLHGAADEPIVIAAQDPAKPPLVRGGGTGVQLVDPAFVTLEDLAFEGQTGNGVNVDDGGTPDTPAHHVVLRRLTVRDVGPDGNRDGIKLSGLEDFAVEACTVVDWGRGGSAVDMVGCHRGTITGSTFRRTADTDEGSGVQAKGGSRDVTVRRCRFERAGSRAVNLGGSTGLAYFRPALASWTGPRHEAKDVRVEGCTFVGSQTPVAFVGADGGVFRFNTVYLPGRWAVRILQETREEGFVPCRGGEVSDNLIVFRADRWAEGGVNRGGGTEPASFRFARNAWCCLDDPPRTRALLALPSVERDGVHGKVPRFEDADALDLRQRKDSPTRGAGADALRD